MKPIKLVVGATGLVGSEVCRRLRARGERVRALVRTTSSKETTAMLHAAGAELITGDLKDAESIASACRGVELVISAACSRLTPQPGDSIESVDAAGQLNLVRAAKEANVRKFVLVSFRTPPIAFPLSHAKEQVENALVSPSEIARPFLTFRRMSDAFAIQKNGLGFLLRSRM